MSSAKAAAARSNMLTRREFGALAVAAFVPQVVGGVRLGVQTYSFRDVPRVNGDAIGPVIAAMRDCGLTECELYAPQVEPAGLTREALRTWREETAIEHWAAIGRRFKDAGITVYAFNYSFAASFSDAEIDRGFAMARALGAEIITASATLASSRRVVPFAATHKMIVAMHGHSNVNDPNQLATPRSFAEAQAMSPWFKINLDIGHFTAAGFDAVPFIREHHADITNLHVKDMVRGVPESYRPWGEGDTPMRDVLQLLKKERWPIRAYIEYEYESARPPVDEVKRCVAFAKQALA
jgi:sugar phosphate isomerase/epimerase